MSDDRPRAVLCAGCGQLVGVNDEECLNCGRRRPARRGLGVLLAGSMTGDAFVTLVMWTCGALYMCTLVVDWPRVAKDAGFDLLAPSLQARFLFGASGALPVFGFGRWWTPLSASWLHGGVIHIAFNLMAVRSLAPAVAHFFGPSRSVILYVVAGVTGFIASTLAGAFIGPIPIIGGGSMTSGASASVFGLLGALLLFGQRGGHSALSAQARFWALGGLMFGLLPGVDNWAHLGGFAGGYLCARLLDPMRPERPWHGTGALICLIASIAAVVVSVITGLPYFRQ